MKQARIEELKRAIETRRDARKTVGAGSTSTKTRIQELNQQFQARMVRGSPTPIAFAVRRSRRQFPRARTPRPPRLAIRGANSFRAPRACVFGVVEKTKTLSDRSRSRIGLAVSRLLSRSFKDDALTLCVVVRKPHASPHACVITPTTSGRAQRHPQGADGFRRDPRAPAGKCGRDEIQAAVHVSGRRGEGDGAAGRRHRAHHRFFERREEDGGADQGAG